MIRFMKLGLQGHSIFFSSGDTGVAGRPANPAPNGCLGSDNTIFNPRFPDKYVKFCASHPIKCLLNVFDSCPYLTVVGATKVYPGFTVFEPESAANDPAGAPYSSAYSTGGGFSNIYSVPPWQQSAVDMYVLTHFTYNLLHPIHRVRVVSPTDLIKHDRYFEDHSPPYPYYSGNDTLGANGGLYNRSGRGYPDVSANGDNIAVYSGGKARLSGGTSASKFSAISSFCSCI